MLNFPQTLSDESKRMLEMCFDWCVSVLQGKRRQCFSGPVHEDTVMMSDSQGLGTEHFTLVTVLSLMLVEHHWARPLSCAATCPLLFL